MNRYSPAFWVVATFVSVALDPAQAATLTGRVPDAASGRALPNTVIRVAGLPLGTFSAADGAYRIERIPPASKSSSVPTSATRPAPIQLSWARAAGAGRYHPLADPPLVQAQATYELEIRVGDETLRASTTTPPQIHLGKAVLLDAGTLAERALFRLFGETGGSVYTAPENQLYYQEGLLEVSFAPVQAAGYQVAIFSLDPGSAFLVDADFLEAEDQADFARQGSSPPIADTRGKVSLPWFSVAYAGRHLFKVFALDRNWFDYTRSNPAGNPGLGGGLAGDSFGSPLFRVEGGIGLFGSASVDSVGFTVLPRR